eukprot:4642247-Prymnesium_polylepis.1
MSLTKPPCLPRLRPADGARARLWRLPGARLRHDAHLDRVFRHPHAHLPHLRPRAEGLQRVHLGDGLQRVHLGVVTLTMGVFGVVSGAAIQERWAFVTGWSSLAVSAVSLFPPSSLGSASS